ncbi:MAG: 5-formyltetrahydrofolate cyclo-ligase [Deltaproteobacteria bacterium]|nr:5-formyltetrahydrofolate cyclo-ligase [Deltaproteobacteria bacterium]
MNKDQLRSQFLDRRLSLSKEEVNQQSEIIQERLLRSSLWPKSGRVALYSAVKNEVKTGTLFQAALEQGLHVYFPRVEQGIAYYEVNGPEDLQKGSWSVLEPKMECDSLPEEAQFDLLVCPGIVLSKTGHRIGYGRGFYDRFIENLPETTPVIALGYDFQVVDEIPNDSWDHSLHGIMTEKNLYQLKEISKKKA